MRKPIFYFLAGFFTAIGLLVILFSPVLLIGYWFVGDEGDYLIKRSAAAPDSAYTAFVYRGMGGGAAGWCSIRLAVLPKEESFDLKKAAEYGDYIFTVSCGSEVELQWLEPRKLLVSYTGLENESGVSVYMRPRSRDGQVKIDYQAK